jgi:NhaA family Na+:H+ antiporter
VRDISFRLRESIPVTERLEDLLHPYTSYVIVPLVALANAGVPITGDVLSGSVSSAVTLGVVVGLVVGKLVGVAGAIVLATRFGLGRLPAGLTNLHVLGMAALAGIGFTVSIFVAGLAFDDPLATDEAKIGVLVASVLAAILGSSILGRARPVPRADSAPTAP